MNSFSPKECALIISNSILKQSKKRRRKITRFQLSLVALRKISQRKSIDEGFLLNFSSEISELGWNMSQVGERRLAFIRTSSANNWLRISSKDMDENINELSELKYKFQNEQSTNAYLEIERYLFKLWKSVEEET